MAGDPNLRPAMSAAGRIAWRSGPLEGTAHSVLRLIPMVQPGGERLKKIDWHWENDSRVLLHSDLGQSLQVAQLQGCRLPGDNRGSILELLRRAELTLGVDDLGPFLTLGFRLAGHGALHGIGQFYVFYLNDADLDAPGLRLLVDNLLEFLIDLVAMDEQLVQV